MKTGNWFISVQSGKFSSLAQKRCQIDRQSDDNKTIILRGSAGEEMINKQRGATTNGESEQKSLKERNVAIETENRMVGTVCRSPCSNQKWREHFSTFCNVSGPQG